MDFKKNLDHNGTPKLIKIVKIPVFGDFSNFLSFWACPHVCNFSIFNFKTSLMHNIDL